MPLANALVDDMTTSYSERSYDSVASGMSGRNH